VRHAQALWAAIEGGVDVRGFHYWSLFDNFEWAAGVGPRFGLFATNYDTEERTARDSVEVYRELAINNQVSQALWKRFRR
jgi:beta-glucosidase